MRHHNIGAAAAQLADPVWEMRWSAAHQMSVLTVTISTLITYNYMVRQPHKQGDSMATHTQMFPHTRATRRRAWCRKMRRSTARRMVEC